MHVTIATVTDTLYAGTAKQVSLPGIDGELAILGHHMPLMTTLKPGTATVVREDGSRENFAIQSGVVEVSHNAVTVLL